jgi:hypothetical protein
MTNEDPGWTPGRNSTRSTNRADRIRAVLDHGEMVELDGGTLVLDSEESPSVVLRLAPGVLGRWPGCYKSGRRCRGSFTTRLDRSSTNWSCRGH